MFSLDQIPDVVLEQESKTYNFDFINTQTEKVKFIITKE